MKRGISFLLITGILLVMLPASSGAADEPTQWSTLIAESIGASTELRRSIGGNPKIESSLNQLLQMHRRDGPAKAQAFAKTRMMVTEDDLVQVVVEATAPEAMSDLIEAVEALGGEYQCQYENLLQSLVPTEALESLAERPDVKVVRKPRRAMPAATVSAGTVVTEGLEASNAPAWHAAGYTGSGVRVAVIDGGFTGYTSLLGTDLPDSVTTYDWTDTGMGGSEHGTACAEIVYDMAPGATIDLHKVDYVVELGNAVSQAIADGVDVISMSMGWSLDGPGDGTGDLGDMVSKARANGILFVTSAGNNAEHSWSGVFTDSEGDDLHEWVAGSEVVNWLVCDHSATPYIIPAGKEIHVALHWDDWTVVDQDYNMYLVYWDGDAVQIVDWSENHQAGGYPWPLESISYITPVEGMYGVVVHKYSATRDVCLRLIASHMGPTLDQRVSERSLCFPADSPNAITVGAVHVDTHDLEPYSSRGPTFGPGGACHGGSTKPDIAAYVGVSTVSYGSGGFYGTSAAAPHVAGAAALVAQAYPSYTPAEIQSFLETGAIDLDPAGKDNVYGSGRLHLPAPTSAPAVTTEAATDIGTDSATLNMSYTLGDYSSVDVRFAYKKAADSAWTKTLWISKSASGTHAEPLSGFNTHTLYDFRGELKYDSTEIRGAALQFTTGSASEEATAEATRSIGPQTIAPGETVQVTVEFESLLGHNEGFALVEGIPAGWVFESVDAGGADFVKVDGTIEWLWLTLEAGATKAVVYTLTAPDDADEADYQIDGVVKAAGVDNPVLGDDTISVDVEVPPPDGTATATRTIDPQTIAPGETVQVTVVFESLLGHNEGFGLVEGIPAGWVFESVDNADATAVRVDGTIEWLWLTLEAGATKAVVYTLTAPDDADEADYQIDGVVKAAGVDNPVLGDDTITVGEQHWYHEWTGDGVIGDEAILEAVSCWLTGTPKNDHILDDCDILWLVSCWLTGEVTPYPC